MIFCKGSIGENRYQFSSHSFHVTMEIFDTANRCLKRQHVHSKNLTNFDTRDVKLLTLQLLSEGFTPSLKAGEWLEHPYYRIIGKLREKPFWTAHRLHQEEDICAIKQLQNRMVVTTGGPDRFISLWNPHTKRLGINYQVHKHRRAGDAEQLHDGRLVVAVWPGIYIWSARKILRPNHFHHLNIKRSGDKYVSPNVLKSVPPHYLALGLSCGLVRIYDVSRKGRPKFKVDLRGLDKKGVRFLEVDAHGHLVGASKTKVMVWDPNHNFNLVGQINHKLVSSVVCSESGPIFLQSGYTSLSIWDPPTMKQPQFLRYIPLFVKPAVLKHSDGSFVGFTSYGKLIRFSAGKRPKTLQKIAEPSDVIGNIHVAKQCLLHNGNILTGNEEGSLHLWKYELHLTKDPSGAVSRLIKKIKAEEKPQLCPSFRHHSPPNFEDKKVDQKFLAKAQAEEKAGHNQQALNTYLALIKRSRNHTYYAHIPPLLKKLNDQRLPLAYLYLAKYQFQALAFEAGKKSLLQAKQLRPNDTLLSAIYNQCLKLGTNRATAPFPKPTYKKVTTPPPLPPLNDDPQQPLLSNQPSVKNICCSIL